MRWIWYVRRWHIEQPELDPAWVLGVIAQESGGNPDAEASDSWGSVGLMQIGPRSWIGTRGRLLDPGTNIRTGMRILSQALKQANGDIRLALAHYNCGEIRVENGKCGSNGGFAYADRVLDYWAPIFRAELVVIAGNTEYPEIQEWLAELGYLYGMGKWDEEVMQPIEPIRVKSSSGFLYIN